MDGFDYIRNAYKYFIPKTPSAALQAVSSGILPEEAFIYKSSSIKPLYEEPFDLDEIERVLAKKNLDLETILLLMSILQQLINDKDSETALFAAESINIIENRYNKKIESLKKKIRKRENPRILREIAIQFYELALINRESGEIMEFYLKESYSCFQKIQNFKTLTINDVKTLVHILLELNKTNKARKLLDRAEQFNKSVELILLRVETEFKAKNYKKVIQILSDHADDPEFSEGKYSEILKFWSRTGSILE